MATVDIGPDNIRTDLTPITVTSGPAYNFYFQVPPGGYTRLRFGFKALWQNVVWIWNGQSREVVQERMNRVNPFWDMDWVSGVNNTGQPITYGLVGWHKTVSWTVDHPERWGWRQSKGMLLEHGNPHPGVSAKDVVGFNDEGGPNFENAVVIIEYVTGPV